MERFFKRPWLIVATIAAVTLFFAAQLPRMQLDNNNFRFVPENDEARLASARIDDSFGSQVIILVGLERTVDTVFDAGFIAAVRAFGEAVESLDLVDSVTSIANADYIGGTADSIVVSSLVPDDFSGTAAEVALVKDRIMEWDLYRRSLVSDDFRSTQVLVSLGIDADDAGNPEASAVHKKIERLAREAGFERTRIHLTGLPVISAVVNDATGADLVFLVPLVVLVVVSVLFLSFRRPGGVVLPLLTVLVSVVWAVGAMPLFGIKLSIITTVLPVILVAVGSAYGIHIVSHYYDEIATKADLSADEHRRLVYAVVRKVGWPVALAALTTFAGFASLCFTSVVPIFEFGLFACFGVAAALLVSLTLVPAILLIRGPARPARRRPARPGESPLGGSFDSAIADAFVAITKRPRTVLAVAAIVSLLSFAAISRLVIDNVLIEYFKSDAGIVESDRFIREHFGGSKSVSVVVTGEEPGDVLRPDVLAAMDGLSTYLSADVPEVGKTTGFTDLLKRINQVFNADESPDGLTRAPEPAAGPEPAAEPADSFGFGFGFSDAEPSPESVTSPDVAPQVSAPPTEKLDGTEVVALLSRAVAGADRRGIDAEELVAQLREAVNYKGAAYYEIPVDPERYAKKDASELKALIGNYLALLSGDISDFADDPLEPRSVRMNVQLLTVGQLDTDRAIAKIDAYVADRFPDDVTVEVGGTALVEKSLNDLVVRTQLSSVAISLFLVFMILTVFYRSPLAGLIGLTPLLITILVNFGLMGALGIKLNIGTAMVASIAVGVGIDYTIHYMAAYHHEFLMRRPGADFRRRTFLTSGKAILFNAASVGAGFAVLALSRFNMLAYLGVLIALTMATSSFVSLTVLPVLLDLTRPAFIRRPRPFDTQDSEMEETE